jgi:serine/threonine protein kinase
LNANSGLFFRGWVTVFQPSMSRMATPGSSLPGGFVLGRLSHADRVGLVYRAHLPDTISSTDGRVASALVLHPLHVEELREWFEKMAVLGRSLRHPRLVEVFALGYTSNELPVLVMEWTEGKTLRNELAGGKVFPPPEVARITREIAEALDYLHQRTPPVLHRVIMPETVLLTTPNNHVKLLAVGHADRPHHPASKVSYLSPEELSGEGTLSAASDVFSLASLAYEILTGCVAFNGNAHAILAGIYRGAIPKVSAAEGTVPVDAVFQRAWSSDSTARYQTAGEFSAALANALEGIVGVVNVGRRVATGKNRAPTIPSTGGPAALSATGRFAAASFHAEAVRPQQASVSGRTAASAWSVPPAISAQAPLAVRGNAAVATHVTPPLAHSISKGTGTHPTTSRETQPNEPVVNAHPGGPLEQDEATVPGDREDTSITRRQDHETLMGRIDDLLARSPRLTDDDLNNTGTTPFSMRKEPLFVPVASESFGGRASDSSIIGGIRRHSGEFPPATVPFSVSVRRGTGEFPPARTGPVDLPSIRQIMESPVVRPSGEFAPAPVPTPFMRIQTGASVRARYVHDEASSSRRSSEPPAALGSTPPPVYPSSVSSSSETDQGAQDATRKLPSVRTAFERDAFAPAPGSSERTSTLNDSREIRFTWPVVLTLLVSHALLTSVAVYSLTRLLPARTPTVVYLPQTATPMAQDVAPETRPPRPEFLHRDPDYPVEVHPLALESAPVAPTVVAPEVVAPEVVAPAVVAPTVVAPTVVAPTVVAPTVVAPVVPPRRHVHVHVPVAQRAQNAHQTQTPATATDLWLAAPRTVAPTSAPLRPQSTDTPRNPY